VLARDAASGRDQLVTIRKAATRAGERAPVRHSAVLAPGEGRTLVRRTARGLGGTVTLTEDRATNGLAARIEDAVLVGKDGVTILPPLEPGATVELRGPEVPFHAYLARLAATPGANARARLALLRASLVRAGGERKLAGFLTPVPPERRTTRGVLEEVQGPVLLIVRDAN
jgi:hypothetical protein